MKRIISTLITSLFLAIILFANVFADTDQFKSIDISLSIPEAVSIATQYSEISFGNVTPKFNYTNFPNIVSLDKDPWHRATALRIRLKAQNNGYAKLYVYTDHKNSEYWNAMINNKIDTATTINGLVNTGRINKYNYYMTTVPLVAWVDWDKKGLTNDPKKDYEWRWIIDKQGGDPSSRGRIQPLLSDYQNLLDRDIDVYILSCWNAPKMAGLYYARIYFSFISQ